MFEPEELMARIVDLEEQLKVSDMAPPAAEQLIACLEGEIAKRDARIVELHNDASYYAARNEELRAELSVNRAQEPIKLHSDVREYLRDGIDSATHCEEGDVDYEFAKGLGLLLGSIYAAPVSEAKAQGVVMPERWNVPRPMWKDARQPYGNPLNHADIEAAEKFNLALDEVARLNAAPVQQVSVPDVSAMARTLADRSADACNVNREDNWAIHGQDYIDDVTAMLAAAPAAPAADAGLVEALDYQVLFDAIAAATSVYANGAVNISVQAFRDALAARRSTGVV